MGAFSYTVPSSAEADSWIPVKPVRNSVSTDVYSINDHNIIVGAYSTQNDKEHGFFGTLDGNYTTFDVGRAFTVPRGINNEGFITGFADAADGTVEEFERSPDGSIKLISKKGSPLSGQALGINSHGAFVGTYLDQESSSTLSFIGKSGLYKHDISLALPNAGVRARAINDEGVVGGYYLDSGTGLTHGFLLNGDIASTVDFPSARETAIEGLNKRGLATGIWDNGDSIPRSFNFDSKAGTFEQLAPPAGPHSEAFGINKAGLVAVTSLDDGTSYIYCPLKEDRCPTGGAKSTSFANSRPIASPSRS
jgi:hypothetical protein